jgi:hypothetical protein
MNLFSTPPNSFNIAAAKASPDYRGIERLLAAAGVAEIVKPLTIQEIDLAFAGSPLSTSQRIACKSALSRVGLLK